ncbi:MAG TPA: V4R domain-containing protein [Longimicrobiales bacterium]
MSTTPYASAELTLPTASLHAMRRALEAEVGVEAAARALHNAGHAAGDALFERLAADTPEISELMEAEFWQRLNALFAERGWGALHFEATHPGIGSLESSDWAEADPVGGAAHPSCHFTAGLLANLLGRTAGDRVGALEVECRSRGDLRCRFLFGGAAALGRLYDALSAGRELEGALAELV